MMKWCMLAGGDGEAQNMNIPALAAELSAAKETVGNENLTLTLVLKRYNDPWNKETAYAADSCKQVCRSNDILCTCKTLASSNSHEQACCCWVSE